MANEILYKLGTPITFLDAGGTVLFTPINLAAGVARQSSEWNRGTTVKPGSYLWEAWCQWQATPVLGVNVRVILKYGDGTTRDNSENGTDANVGALDKLRNLHYLDSIACDQAASNTHNQRSGVVEIVRSHVQVIFANDAAVALRNSTLTSGFRLTPVITEVQ